MALYNTIRAISALVGLCLALSNQGGHFIPLTGITCLMLALVTATLDESLSKPGRVLTVVGAAFVAVALVIMIVLQIWTPHNMQYYSEWIVAGGTCPRVVGGLKGWKCSNQLFFGCSVDVLVQNHTANSTVQSGYLGTINPHDDNLISWSELVVAIYRFLPDDLLRASPRLRRRSSCNDNLDPSRVLLVELE